MRQALHIAPRLALLGTLGCLMLGFGGSTAVAQPTYGPIIVAPVMHSCDVKHHTMGSFDGAG